MLFMHRGSTGALNMFNRGNSYIGCGQNHRRQVIGQIYILFVHKSYITPCNGNDSLGKCTSCGKICKVQQVNSFLLPK